MTYSKEIVREWLDQVAERAKEYPEWVDVFERCYTDTLDNTVEILADGSTFVLTGDIPAMWLRDSTAQLRPYLHVAKRDPRLCQTIAGLVKRQMILILKDPYANSFNIEENWKGHHETDHTDLNGWIWERKYEVEAELMGQFYKLKYFAGDLQREIRYPVSEMQESFWKKNLSLARGAFWAEEVDDFYHTLRLGELPHSTCLSYRTGSQRECLLAAFDSNKKIVLVKKDEAVVARACLRLTKGAFQKPPAVDFSFADLSQENMDIGKPVTSEKPVLFLESIYTFGLNDIEKEEVMKLAVSLTTQKAAELGVVAVLARRYLGCYERDEYVLAPFYVYISKSKNGWQYLDSLGGAAYTSAKEEYVEHPFLVIQTAMHHAGAHNRNEVDYE